MGLLFNKLLQFQHNKPCLNLAVTIINVFKKDKKDYFISRCYIRNNGNLKL